MRSHINQRHPIRLFATIAAMSAVAAIALIAGALPARAEAGIDILEATAVSEFPAGIRFRLELESDEPIEEVAVRFKVAGEQANQYNYLDLAEMGAGSSRATLIAGEYFVRKSTRNAYSPPGTIVEYYFEVIAKSGETTTTDPQELIYMDARYEWDSVTVGPITAFYHGPVRVRATSMAQIASDTFDSMGPLLGAEIETPVRIIMYNNNAEMLGALADRSGAIASELITEGQAFGEQNVVLLLGNGRRAGGTISHELTHVLVQRATDDNPLSVPLWLNEGLAEFGNVDPGQSYDRYLEWAVDTDRTTPLESLTVFPGDPNLQLVSYGQSRSAIEFMIEEFGREKMTELMAAFDSGFSFDAAFRRTYGMSVREFDNLWRAEVGAASLSASQQFVPSAAESPTPRPTTAPTGLLTLEDVAAAGARIDATTAPELPGPDASPAAVASPESPGTNGGASGGCSAPSRSGAAPEASAAALTVLPLVGAVWVVARSIRKRL